MALRSTIFGWRWRQRATISSALENGCGGRVAVCALRDQSRFADPSRNLSFYEVTQTYRLPVVVEENENKVEDVAKLAPEAGYLLTTAFPYLTLREADDILTETEGPGGDFWTMACRSVCIRVSIYTRQAKKPSLVLLKRPNLVSRSLARSGGHAGSNIELSKRPVDNTGGTLTISDGAHAAFFARCSADRCDPSRQNLPPCRRRSAVDRAQASHWSRRRLLCRKPAC